MKHITYIRSYRRRAVSKLSFGSEYYKQFRGPNIAWTPLYSGVSDVGVMSPKLGVTTGGDFEKSV